MAGEPSSSATRTITNTDDEQTFRPGHRRMTDLPLQMQQSSATSRSYKNLILQESLEDITHFQGEQDCQQVQPL